MSARCGYDSLAKGASYVHQRVHQDTHNELARTTRAHRTKGGANLTKGGANLTKGGACAHRGISEISHEHLRQRHLSMVPVGAVGDGTDIDWNTAHCWRCLEPVSAVTPEADALCDVPGLVEAVSASGPNVVALPMIPVM
jgi:hypothetical protein